MHERSIVDQSSPDAIREAVKYVNGTKGLRIQPGIDALWVLFRAPSHQMPYAELEEQFGALDLHFGWFCKHVAIELGDTQPAEFALTDKLADENGLRILRLKASVVAAMSQKVASK